MVEMFWKCRKALCSVVTVSLFMFMAFSNAGYACEQQYQHICQFVEELRSRIHVIVLEGKAVRESLGQAVQEVLDFPRLAKFAMGQYWKDADIRQRDEFQDAYSQYIKKVYVTQLKEFAHHWMKIMSVRALGEGKYAVRVRLTHPEHRDDFIVLEFHIVEASTIKISDIRINNSLSISINQRTMVNEVIQKYGIDGAISHFRE
ncbi:phospholipid-binding protein MlaC [Anaplasma phagocytophilum]|uniref:MlaC/ttg2D family ABC transporter substrate-binding protein n=1 Tax=Anaplasma phagocytophilum TaxID=948 RepID=UPI00201AC2A3